MFVAIDFSEKILNNQIIFVILLTNTKGVRFGGVL